MDTSYNFEVEEKKLTTTDGIEVPNKAIVRADTGKVLSVMGEDYALVKHKDVIDQFENSIGEELSDRKITLCRNGAILFAHYRTPKVQNVEVKKGDIVQFGIEIFNSYDGSLPVGFIFTALRLACLNGMTIPKSIARISVRHRGNPELTNIKDTFIKRIPLYLNVTKRWQEWTEIIPSENRVKDFLSDTFGKRHNQMFKELYSGIEDKSLWGLYNMFTHYNTHSIKIRKNNIQNKRLAQFNFEHKTLERFYNYDWTK